MTCAQANLDVAYKATMTERQFQFICARLRFEDKNTRVERREIDVLSPIRDV